ncbi:MAG: universal stress protein [Rhodospirillaceae bacterium]|nr:universal stress protein [Rhodospirillaceae bacterium]MBT5192037.1 universal stress protein [Rhodospirillaceae bacterium]MBT5897872.1 universal stress protein [Rhodospirillaceae bacterium]MBT6431348.1 universal stress protein [Rhodospirillaceae bacterium]MBT7760395.1 universal stress protein [Rhodospirillaceae bacterium]
MNAPQNAQIRQTRDDRAGDTAPVSLGRILVALDASEHANKALDEVIRLARSSKGVVTGIHAYAAQLHDRRFKMMEGGLPERYLEEQEMGYQREVHDDLITRGLNIISDSYHDAGGAACDAAGVTFKRLSPEGKNYTKVVEATRSGDFDMLALGALGVGAVPGNIIGTVAERVVRRSPIDTFVIRNPDLSLGDGPIVVGIDGSPLSYGALMTALDLAARIGAEVKAVAAYDPYYHYVAFNKIAGVLSEEAGKVFRFKEQEQLHEELIDDGIAKIYQSHLEVAETIAEDLGVKITTKLLDGKPYKAILDYIDAVGASLLVVGKTGVHGDAELDIGGNAENLLRLAPCHMWLTQTVYNPPLDMVAEETVAWSVEAERKISRAPEFVRDMARRMVLRHTQKLGHTFVTSDLVDEVMGKAMPGFARNDAAKQEELSWSPAAERLLETVAEPAVADNIRLRAIKRARRDHGGTVMPKHVTPFLDLAASDRPNWTAAALARVAKVPEMVRESVKAGIEDLALERDLKEVSLELAEEGVAEARKAMCPVPEAKAPDEKPDGLSWSPDAEARLARVPEGFMREMTRQRVESFAREAGAESVTLAMVEEKYAGWAKGSAKDSAKGSVGSSKRQPEMECDADAAARIQRIPDFIRPMVKLEIERCARDMGLDRITGAAIDKAGEAWEGKDAFHSEGVPGQYKS